MDLIRYGACINHPFLRFQVAVSGERRRNRRHAVAEVLPLPPTEEEAEDISAASSAPEGNVFPPPPNDAGRYPPFSGTAEKKNGQLKIGSNLMIDEPLAAFSSNSVDSRERPGRDFRGYPPGSHYSGGAFWLLKSHQGDNFRDM